MTRNRLGGLCVAAVFAFSAMATSSAQAAPVWGFCGKAVPKDMGTYTEKTCKTESVPPKTGKFSFFGLHKFPEKFDSKFNAVRWNMGANGEVVCSKGTDDGSITAASETKTQITLGHCDLAGDIPCTTAGKKAGEIQTKVLRTRLLGFGEQAGGGQAHEPAAGEIWIEYGVGLPVWTEFECAGVLIKVTGSATPPVKRYEPGRNTRTFKEGEKGEQALTFEGSKAGVQTFQGGGLIEGDDVGKGKDEA